MNTARRRCCALYFMLIPLLVIAFTSPLPALAGDEPQADAPQVSAVASALGIAHGAHLPPVFIQNGFDSWYSYGDELLAFNNLIGKDLAVVMFFASWSPFDPLMLDEIQRRVPVSRQPVIMITWEPSRWSTGCDLGYGDGQGPEKSVNMGRCDDYIRGFARALKARPERIIIRFAHEMNIKASDWWPGHWGADAGSYVSMFRRVRSIFREEGATKIEWMWSPAPISDTEEPWNDLHNYYPGNSEVDWLGLSGYNWYTYMGQPWRDFRFLYQGILNDFACNYPKPVLLAEISSVDGPGESDKARWITDAYAHVSDFPFVRGVIWFNDWAYADRNRGDLRVTTGTQDCHDHGGCSGVQALPGSAGQQTTNAFISAVRQSTVTSKLPSLADATPPYTLCSAPKEPFTLSTGTVMLRPGGSANITVRGFLYPSPVQISVDAPSGIRASAAPAALSAPWGVSTVKLSADAKLPQGVYRVTIRVGSTSLPVTISNLQVRGYLPTVGR